MDAHEAREGGIVDANEARGKALAWLRENGVAFTLEEHAAVYTMEEVARLGIGAEGANAAATDTPSAQGVGAQSQTKMDCKNLFLRDAKGARHILVSLCAHKRADLADIQAQLGCTKLSFASEERLERFLGLSRGAVSPLGVVNDAGRAVEVAFDCELENYALLGYHPNVNTATVWLRFADLRRAIEARGNRVTLIRA